MSLLNRVIEVASEVFGIDANGMTAKTAPEDIMRWDSLGHMQLITKLEETFGVQFGIDEITGGSSIGAPMASLRQSDGKRNRVAHRVGHR